MPSFDIVNKIEMQELENALNNSRKEIATRYDFRGTITTIELDKKEKKIHIVAAEANKMEAVREILLNHVIRRKVDPKALEFGDHSPTALGALKRDVKIKEGIPQDIAKQIVKLIKEAKMKVQASIQGDELRVTGKKIDDLQEVIALVRGADLKLPLQFVNMKG